MKEYKYINTELDINLGDIFKHKADDRKMVIYDFYPDGNGLSQTTKDKSIPICRYFNEKTDKYELKNFKFHELIKVL